MSAAGLSKEASNADRRRRLTMSRGSVMNEIRLPSHEEPVPAVTILDGEGRVVRVVPANEFRRGPILPRRHPAVSSRRGGRSMPGESPAAVAARQAASLDPAHLPAPGILWL